MALVGLCFVLFTCVIVSTSVVQDQNLRRRHGHHFYPNYYQDFEESVPRNLSRRLEDEDLKFRQYPYRRQKRRESSGVVERMKRQKDERRRQEDLMEDASMKFVVRGKRSNTSNISYKNLSDQDRRELDISRQLKLQHELQLINTSSGLRASFEMEEKDAHNSALCNSSVELIPDTRGTRMPKDLKHIKCNHAGSKCQNTGDNDYYCTQVYRNVEMSYSNGEGSETMKIFAGCVCSLQDLNNDLLLQSKNPRINN